MELPETQYANSGGVHLAYQVIGDGPIDLLVVAEAFSHCELRWEEPSLDGFSVTVPGEISIRVDRRGPSAEIKTAPSKRQEK